METKTFTHPNGITYTYNTIEELIHLKMCIQCPKEKQCHDDSETCEEFKEALANN